MVKGLLECEGQGLGDPPPISPGRAWKAWSLPPPVPEVEAAWIIEAGWECSGMRGSEAGGSFPTTPQQFEVTKGLVVMNETAGLLPSVQTLLGCEL